MIGVYVILVLVVVFIGCSHLLIGWAIGGSSFIGSRALPWFPLLVDFRIDGGKVCAPLLRIEMRGMNPSCGKIDLIWHHGQAINIRICSSPRLTFGGSTARCFSVVPQSGACICLFPLVTLTTAHNFPITPIFSPILARL